MNWSPFFLQYDLFLYFPYLLYNSSSELHSVIRWVTITVVRNTYLDKMFGNKKREGLHDTCLLSLGYDKENTIRPT